MTKSLTKNYIYSMLYKLLTILLPLITTPYLSRVLGADNIGIYSFTISIATYFVLAGNLGVAFYGQKEIAYVQDDKKARTRKFYEIFFLRTIAMILSLILFSSIFATHGDYQVYYLILILDLVASIFDISWFFQGMEEFKITVVRNLIVKTLGLILTFALVRTSADLSIYFWIYVGTNLIGNLSFWPSLRKYLTKVSFSELKILPHLKPCIILFIPQIATQVYTMLDKVMIGWLSSDIAEVAFYEQPQKIINAVLVIITSLGAAMLPRIATYFAKKDSAKIESAILKSFNFSILLAIPIMFGLIAVSDSLIPWFLGEGFEKSTLLTKVISPIVLFIALSNVIGIQYLLPVKKEKQYTAGVITGAVVNFILNFILIQCLDSIGAAIATVIAEFSVLLVMAFATRKDFNYKSIFLPSLKYGAYGLLMLASCFVVQLFLSPSTFCMFVQLLTGILIYGTCLLVTKDPLFLEAAQKFKSFIPSHKK